MRNLVRPLLAPMIIMAIAGRAAAQQAVDPPTFRVSVDLVTTDLLARDARTSQFVANLRAEEIEIYEDGVRQKIASLLAVQGGRVFNILSAAAAPAREGIILPPVRPSTDTSGRIFVIFIDDLHLDARLTAQTRNLLRQILRLLIHDGDMFGIVSTGTSSISEQLTYDRQVLESAIERVTGGGLTPREIIEGGQGSQGPTELRHRAQVAFSTAYELIRNLERVEHRRKAVIYISSGYDFDPFETGRLEEQVRRMQAQTADDLQADPFYRQQRSSQELSATDLVRELAELTRAANRANATIYPIDPRGLVAGPDIDQDVNMQDWNAHVRDSQDTLRVLAADTGGFAVVNMNSFEAGLTRIDNETSDYYVVGYYSTNADPLKRTRRIEVKVTRPGVDVWHRESYSLRPPAPRGNE